MDKIICLVGESGSGKSTIAELLEKEGYNYIKSYTTRPRRIEDEKGHIFVEEEYFKAKYKGSDYKNELIAYTEFHGYRYWSTKSQYKDKGISIYVVEPRGAVELKNYITDCKVIVIYLKADKEERFNRMESERGKQQALKRLAYDSDSGIFNLICCDYVVDANRRNLNDIVKDVSTIIKS